MRELPAGNYSGNIIQSVGTADLICCHTSYLSGGFNAERHYHRHAHLSFVLTGACTEKRLVSVRREPGHLCFYHAGEPHQVSNVSSDSRHINLEIGENALNTYALSEADLAVAAKAAATKFQLIKIHQELRTNDEYSANGIIFLLTEMCVKAKREQHFPSWVTKVKDYLHEYYWRVVGLQELSAVAGAHPVTISKYFRRYFGCSLSTYQRHLKVERSLNLLKQNRAAISAVAFDCGFADQSHFTRSFKELTGISPANYKNL